MKPIRSAIIEQLWTAQRGLCFHCGAPMRLHGSNEDELRWSREHLFPQAFYHGQLTSIVLAHGGCNSRRGSPMPTEDEVTRAQAIYAAAGLAWYAPGDHRRHGDHKPLGNMADLWPQRSAAE